MTTTLTLEYQAKRMRARYLKHRASGFSSFQERVLHHPRGSVGPTLISYFRFPYQKTTAKWEILFFFFFLSSYTLGWLPAVSFTAWVPFLNITSASFFFFFKMSSSILWQREKKNKQKNSLFFPYWFCQALWNPDTPHRNEKKSPDN